MAKTKKAPKTVPATKPASETKPSRHVTPRKHVALPEPYGSLLEKMADKNERDYVKEACIAIRERAERMSMWPPSKEGNSDAP